MRYLRNVVRSLNSTMMNSASPAVFSGRWTLPSLQPSAPAATDAGSVGPIRDGEVHRLVGQEDDAAGRCRCITDFSPGPYFTRRKRATSFSKRPSSASDPRSRRPEGSGARWATNVDDTPSMTPRPGQSPDCAPVAPELVYSFLPREAVQDFGQMPLASGSRFGSENWFEELKRVGK